jgi:ketosteroid isomerase-like protein
MIRFALSLMLVPVLVVASARNLPAQQEATTATEAADFAAEREQLRALREAVVEAIIAGDIEAQLKYAHPEIVTTWQNNDTANGHDGLKHFMEDNLSKQKIFQGYTERPSSDVVSIYHDGTLAVAQGKSIPHYKFLGKEFDLENRWTATLLKEGEDWKIVGYHVSGNIADNPLLSAAKSSLIWVGLIAFAVGLVVGLVGGKLTKKSA